MNKCVGTLPKTLLSIMNKPRPLCLHQRRSIAQLVSPLLTVVMFTSSVCFGRHYDLFMSSDAWCSLRKNTSNQRYTVFCYLLERKTCRQTRGEPDVQRTPRRGWNRVTRSAATRNPPPTNVLSSSAWNVPNQQLDRANCLALSPASHIFYLLLLFALISNAIDSILYLLLLE